MNTPKPTTPQVRVGVGVFILKSNQEPRANPSFIIGQRIGSHGAETWALPGGHLDFGETPETCAEREAMEETGLKVRNVRFLTATNDYMPADGKHYITMFMICEREDEGAQPQTLEPDKCRAWEWASWEDLLGWVAREKFEDEAGEKGDVVGRKLFTPLLNMVDQRPGVVPTWD